MRAAAVVPKVAAACCGEDLVAEYAAFAILVDRKRRGERAPLVRCRFCNTMNELGLVDGLVVAEVSE